MEKKQGKYGSDGLSINQKLGMQILYNILIYNPLLFVFQEYSFYLEKQFLLKIFPVPGPKGVWGSKLLMYVMHMLAYYQANVY